MKSLREKYKKYDFMKWLRKTRNNISKEIHNLNAEEVDAYFDKGAKSFDEKNEELKRQNIYFTTITNDFIIREALVLFNDKFNSFQWVWDHQEEVYNATRGKNWSELVNYFESIYQYIQDN